jgi:hypothetical protein
MQVEVDLLNDVALLVNREYEVLDAFRVRGRTQHEAAPGVVFFTFRSYLTPPSQCAVCGRTVEEVNEPCTSSGGFHAFVGVSEDAEILPLHRAEARNMPLVRIHFEDLPFWVEPDNLFPIDQISKRMVV